jgi:photosystem II stability/assembly factor-like uncharacterized protein
VTCALGATVSTAAAVVTTPTSGWFWRDPTPQGNEVLRLRFVGNRDYAVAAFGTTMRTHDGGLTWTGLRILAAS